ncbi:hypothetical protein E2320_007040, partial [Naja naja]
HVQSPAREPIAAHFKILSGLQPLLPTGSACHSSLLAGNVRLNGRPPHIFTSPNLALLAKSLDTPTLEVSSWGMAAEYYDSKL